MKNSNMLSTLALLVGVVALIVALYEFYQFVMYQKPQGGFDPQGGTNYLWMAIAATVVAFICGLVFFVRRVNKEEEIHITQ
jgi:uncharacterized membrane protein